MPQSPLTGQFWTKAGISGSVRLYCSSFIHGRGFQLRSSCCSNSWQSEKQLSKLGESARFILTTCLGGIRLAFKWNIHPFPPLLDRGKFILKQNWTHSYLRYICATRKPPHMYFSNKYTRWRGVFRGLSQHENLEFSTNLCAFPFKGVMSIDTAWSKTSRWIVPLTRLNGNFWAHTK
jgi:hypothetical protein